MCTALTYSVTSCRVVHASHPTWCGVGETPVFLPSQRCCVHAIERHPWLRSVLGATQEGAEEVDGEPEEAEEEEEDEEEEDEWEPGVATPWRRRRAPHRAGTRSLSGGSVRACTEVDRLHKDSDLAKILSDRDIRLCAP